MSRPRAQRESSGLACRESESERERDRERETERERQRERKTERERERESARACVRAHSENGCSIRPAACGLAVRFLLDLVAEKLKQ